MALDPIADKPTGLPAAAAANPHTITESNTSVDIPIDIRHISSLSYVNNPEWSPSMERQARASIVSRGARLLLMIIGLVGLSLIVFYVLRYGVPDTFPSLWDLIN